MGKQGLKTITYSVSKGAENPSSKGVFSAVSLTSLLPLPPLGGGRADTASRYGGGKRPRGGLDGPPDGPVRGRAGGNRGSSRTAAADDRPGAAGRLAQPDPRPAVGRAVAARSVGRARRPRRASLQRRTGQSDC